MESLTTKQDRLTAGEAAERAGAAMGDALVKELLNLRGKPQEEAFRATRNKLHALAKLPHADRAAEGFAVTLVSVLVTGIDNLPTERGLK